jgi:hypothetical protein
LPPGGWGFRWRSEDTGFAAHSLGECFSAFTTFPLDPRIQPLEAERLMEHNVVAYFELVEAEWSDYREAIRRCFSSSAIGGMVVDALRMECARKAGVDRIYTCYTRHFEPLAPRLAGIVCAP